MMTMKSHPLLSFLLYLSAARPATHSLFLFFISPSLLSGLPLSQCTLSSILFCSPLFPFSFPNFFLDYFTIFLSSFSLIFSSPSCAFNFFLVRVPLICPLCILPAAPGHLLSAPPARRGAVRCGVVWLRSLSPCLPGTSVAMATSLP